MIGDNIDNDIGGTQKAGIRGILVCTGKHNQHSPQRQQIQPETILPSIANLVEWLINENRQKR